MIATNYTERQGLADVDCIKALQMLHDAVAY